MSSGSHWKWVPAAAVGGGWWDSWILAGFLGLCQAWWSLQCAVWGSWTWSQGLFVPTETSVLTTWNYPSMAPSFLFEKIPNLPSCPGDKAHGSAAWADTCCWLCSLPTQIICELVLLKHLVFSIPFQPQRCRHPFETPQFWASSSPTRVYISVWHVKVLPPALFFLPLPISQHLRWQQDDFNKKPAGFRHTEMCLTSSPSLQQVYSWCWSVAGAWEQSPRCAVQGKALAPLEGAW